MTRLSPTTIVTLAGLVYCFLAIGAAIVEPVHAYSAELYDTATCSPASAQATATKEESGSCIAINRVGGKATCNADGTAQVTLYLRSDCSVLAASGVGRGDGVSCIPIRFTDGSGTWGAYIDCSAPGPDSSSLSSGAIAGIVVACVFVGLVVLSFVAAHFNRRYKEQRAFQLQHDVMHMKTTEGSTVTAAGAAMAYGPSVGPGRMLNVALLACVCLAFVPAGCHVHAISIDLRSDEDLISAAMFQLLGQLTAYVALMLWILRCCGARFGVR